MAGHTWLNSLNGAWFNVYTPTVADFTALDAALTSAINGDGGGAYTPSAPIFIGGAGLWFAGPTTFASGATASFSTTFPLAFGDSDYFVLGAGHSGATRTIRTPCVEAASAFGYGITVGTAYAALESLIVGSRAIIPLRVHQGATLASATLTFAVAQTHTLGAPAFLPGFRVYQRSIATGVVTPLVASGGDGNGFVYPATPASGTAWYAAGAAQTLTYTLAAATVIDRTQSTYFAEIVDESGRYSQTQNLYTDILLSFTSIPDNRPA